ncbi:ABC transporter ATP-binding protein [Leekyejoonella antrihumi]|uniref:ABC transporter ATP-binding protein n=1 Tax=Leekyejoonella antrihumi TaxID=1660198 RepID=A0A563DYA1_9MICO|nr:ABC transporter ATP-binding protein [Leekyejoonella antrihumi]TWP34951.1 ABC transporter ATP-binding protein [Leekyejoonella antrihumi]
MKSTEDEQPALTARSVVMSYGHTPALKGISLAIGKGEIVAVTGPSGSGKSSLLLCLAGVVTPDAGEVTFGDRRISAEGEGQRSRLRRTEFGVLFQFGQLVPELTAIENVALPLLLGGRRRSEAMTAALTWLDRFEVGGLASTRPSSMSGGQAGRVAVARAMVAEPKVLFADEPTGALDTLAGEQVMAQLIRVTRESGTTVLLVTHDARVSAYGDREIRIRDGQLDHHPARHLASVSGPDGDLG